MADILLGEGKRNQRASKRKRIRRLADLDIPVERRKRFRGNADVEISKPKRCIRRVFLIFVIISVSLVIFFGNIASEYSLVTKFLNNYEEHYHQIVHGNRNYCRDELDVSEIFRKVHKSQIILHQEEALNELKWALEDWLIKKNRSFIALVGPIGIGKSLFIHSFQKHFPWPENVYSYAWNTFETDKFQNVRVFIEQFSDCGCNLLIIKNLRPVDKSAMEFVIDMIKEQKDARQKRSIVFFVFNLNTMLNETEYLEQHVSLQNLYHTKTINFRNFSKKELEDCIRLELKLENMTISRNIFHELMDTIDVKRSGCKNVYAKIKAFGRKVL